MTAQKIRSIDASRESSCDVRCARSCPLEALKVGRISKILALICSCRRWTCSYLIVRCVECSKNALNLLNPLHLRFSRLPF